MSIKKSIESIIKFSWEILKFFHEKINYITRCRERTEILNKFWKNLSRNKNTSNRFEVDKEIDRVDNKNSLRNFKIFPQENKLYHAMQEKDGNIE